MIEEYNNHKIDEAYKYRESYLEYMRSGKKPIP